MIAALQAWALLSAGWISRGAIVAYKNRRRIGATVKDAITGAKPEKHVPKITEVA